MDWVSAAKGPTGPHLHQRYNLTYDRPRFSVVPPITPTSPSVANIRSRPPGEGHILDRVSVTTGPTGPPFYVLATTFFYILAVIARATKFIPLRGTGYVPKKKNALQ